MTDKKKTSGSGLFFSLDLYSLFVEPDKSVRICRADFQTVSRKIEHNIEVSSILVSAENVKRGSWWIKL